VIWLKRCTSILRDECLWTECICWSLKYSIGRQHGCKNLCRAVCKPTSCCLCAHVTLHLFTLPPDAAGEHAALHRQRSLPHRPPVIPLVARMADQNTSGTPVMTEREASRLDKFKQLLAGPNTDLGKRRSSRGPRSSAQSTRLQC